MTLHIRAAAAAGVSGLAALALFVPNVSATAGTRTFDEVYPVASTLCAKATAGTLPKRLAASDTQVLAACTTLQDDFTQLTLTVSAAEGAYAAVRAAEQAKVDAVCPPTAGLAAREDCRTARIEARIANAEALLTRHNAVITYRSAIETNRVAFWSGIHSLRGTTT